MTSLVLQRVPVLQIHVLVDDLLFVPLESKANFLVTQDQTMEVNNSSVKEAIYK